MRAALSEAAPDAFDETVVDVPGGRGEMSNRNSVRDILYRAGAEGRMPVFDGTFSTPAQGVSLILKQLENGVLPRRYRLAFRHGGEVTLDLAERQVLSLGPLQAPKGAIAALEPGPLGPDDAKALGDLLSGFCRGARSVRMSSTPATDIFPGSGGSRFRPCARRRPCPTWSPRPRVRRHGSTPSSTARRSTSFRPS
jgi:hypothetical protein